MHRLIQDHLEEVLRETERVETSPASAHLAVCNECREEVDAMRSQASALRALRANDDTLAPRPGFYARVMERIEAQRPIDIWQLFFDSAFARRIAMASMAMAVLFSLYLVSSERFAQPVAVAVEESQPDMTLSVAGLPDKDAVLVNLVTYREQ
jgi:predicted anti-sigma-YlaC factor YlaD